MLKIPEAPMSIQKGVPLKLLLDQEAVTQLAQNIHFVHPSFQTSLFVDETLQNIEALGLKERSAHIAMSLKTFLPNVYSEALEILLKSLTPPLKATEGNGLAGLFYMPHCRFIEEFGGDLSYNNNVDPFDVSMSAQYKLTTRFTCEYSVRPFLAKDESRTLQLFYQWMNDENPHVRRLCSEGTRPRLPWAKKLDSFISNPEPCIPILERLKDDPDLYVRRSVANHVGDIAKDNLEVALSLCEKWLKNPSSELKWVIRHALRNPVKRNVKRAIELRNAAK
ncbi:MAG: DNA alkylation repair protein [Flavobacteriales bacterium]